MLTKSLGLVALTALFGSLGVDAGCRTINSIPYCESVMEINYANIGFAGSYNQITNMDPKSCTCSSTKKPFAGGLAPLNEELSLHFRGPLHLKQFGVYYPARSNSKRDEDAALKKKIDDDHAALRRRHAHHHIHKRAVTTKIVTSTVTEYVDVTTTPTPAAGSGSGSDSDKGGSIKAVGSGLADKLKKPIEEKKSKATSGKYERTAYYNAETGTADGLVFLAHYGGQGSGTFDSCFGNSLSYMNPTCSGGSSSPKVLADTVIPSNVEFSIFSSAKCSGSSCGYVRPDSVAHHGFGGTDKIFVFEFSMPKASGPATPINYDMPAIWSLNAQIPRTLQYGKGECSCWDTGCGELDLFEVLEGATDMLKTHYHSKQGAKGKYGGGGAPQYFDRPYGNYVKAAVIFNGNGASIRILDDNVEFGEFINGFETKSDGKVSVFSVPL